MDNAARALYWPSGNQLQILFDNHDRGVVARWLQQATDSTSTGW